MTLPYVNPYTVGDIVEFDGITWFTDEVKYTVSQQKGIDRVCPGSNGILAHCSPDA